MGSQQSTEPSKLPEIPDRVIVSESPLHENSGPDYVKISSSPKSEHVKIPPKSELEYVKISSSPRPRSTSGPAYTRVSSEPIPIPPRKIQPYVHSSSEPILHDVHVIPDYVQISQVPRGSIESRSIPEYIRIIS